MTDHTGEYIGGSRASLISGLERAMDNDLSISVRVDDESIKPRIMEIIFENSDKIPEGDYLELMNLMKKDKESEEETGEMMGVTVVALFKHKKEISALKKKLEDQQDLGRQMIIKLKDLMLRLGQKECEDELARMKKEREGKPEGTPEQMANTYDFFGLD